MLGFDSFLNMSSQLTPSKRPHDQSGSEPNGKGKLAKSTYFTSQNTSFKITPGSVVFRVLCPAAKTGSVIGKGGNKISQIRQESGAKVRVEETMPGCNERVIVIAGSGNENEISNNQSKDADEEPIEIEENKESKENQDVVDTNDAEKHKSVEGEDLQSEKVASSVQKALMLVFERMAEGEPEINGGDEDLNKDTTTFTMRLLLFSSQVGCLLGKTGGVIKQMACDSGAQIQILPKDKLPLCASSSDELVQVFLFLGLISLNEVNLCNLFSTKLRLFIYFLCRVLDLWRSKCSSKSASICFTTAFR